MKRYELPHSEGELIPWSLGRYVLYEEAQREIDEWKRAFERKAEEARSHADESLRLHCKYECGDNPAGADESASPAGSTA